MKQNIRITGGLICVLLFTGIVLLFLVPRKKYRIAVLPLGKVEQIYIDSAREALTSFYGAEVTVLPSIPLPAEAYYAPRKRYRADSLLVFLKNQKTKEFDKVIGITEKDISTTHEKYKDWGIMGLAYKPGVSGVISTFRLKTGARSLDHILERFQKVVLHETGHTFGASHCSQSKSCLMRAAEGMVSTVDEEKKEMCNRCQQKVEKAFFTNY